MRRLAALWEISMKTLLSALAATGLLALSACGGGADDRAAENIEAAAESRADALEDQADATGNAAAEEALEDRAENVRDIGEDAAEAADDKDDARIENQVAPALNQM